MNQTLLAHVFRSCIVSQEVVDDAASAQLISSLQHELKASRNKCEELELGIEVVRKQLEDALSAAEAAQVT